MKVVHRVHCAEALAIATLCTAFVVSRRVFTALGVRYQYDPVRLVQVVDTGLLRDDLWRSVFYLHSQPPLFNLVTGAMLNLAPQTYAAWWTLIYLGLGLLLTAAMYSLLRYLDVPRALAAVATIFFMVTPATLLYENWYFYAYPVAALLTAAFAALMRFIHRPTLGYLMLFTTAVTLVALLRASYHLFWVLGMVGLMWLVGRARLSRRQLALAALPCALVLAVYVKNYLVFGTFSTSSWMGMNLYRVAVRNFPDDERTAMLHSGALQAEWQAVWTGELQTGYTPQPRFESIPVLANEERAPGYPNLNHHSYLELSGKLMCDSLTMIRHCPACYAQTVGQGVMLFLAPASTIYSDPRRPDSEPPTFADIVEGRERYWALFIGIPLTLVAAVWLTLRAIRRHNLTAPVLLGMAGTCLFISAVYIFLEFGENNRFRYEIDPLLWVLAVYAVWRAIEFVRRIPQHAETF